jgi:hypothetical protein
MRSHVNPAEICLSFSHVWSIPTLKIPVHLILDRIFKLIAVFVCVVYTLSLNYVIFASLVDTWLIISYFKYELL